MITKAGLEDIEVFVRKTPELMHLAECCIAVSGSVSLELLYQKKPTVIVYTISRLGYFIQSIFCRVRYITLVNLLLAKEIFLNKNEYSGTWAANPNYVGRDKAPEKALFPEYLTHTDKSPQIAGHIIRWLLVDEYRESATAELAKLKARIAHGGASRNAAEIMLSEVTDKSAVPLKTHFVPGMYVESSAGAEAA
jgi:lipid-A-disaccharide synthase